MPRLIALRPLCGDYGSVCEGEAFDTDEQRAESLEARGLAARFHEPSLIQRLAGKMFHAPENKMMPPLANKAAEPVVHAPQVIVEPEPPPVYRMRPPIKRGMGR